MLERSEISIRIEGADTEDSRKSIYESANARAVIEGPVGAVMDLIDKVIAFTQANGGGVLAATAEDVDGTVTDILTDEEMH